MLSSLYPEVVLKSQFAKVTKRLRDANGIPIGISNDNPMLDTRIYDVEFRDGYKASLSANELAINLFFQCDEEGNRYVLFQDIVDHRTDGSEVLDKNAFIISKMAVEERGRQPKDGNF